MHCGHVLSHFIYYTKKDPYKLVGILLYAGCLLTLAMVLVNPDEALKVFIVSTVLAVTVVYKNFRFLVANKRLLILPAFMLAFGLLQNIWVEMFKESGSAFSGAYRSYQNGGKVLIFAAIVMVALNCQQTRTLRASTPVNYMVIATGLGLYGYAGYQLYAIAEMHFTSYRVPLGFEHATGTAYALTFIALLASQALLNLHSKIGILLYFLHFLLSCTAIVITQTRAAILVYPVLCIGLFFLHYRHDRKVLLSSFIAFLVLGTMVLIALKPILENRYADFERDIYAYSNDNSNTSIGARFAMQRAGFYTGEMAIWSQSLEKRSISLTKLAENDPSIRGALNFVKVHLHNEIMDTFSLKGIIGVALLTGLYAAMLYTAYIFRSPLFLVISGAIIIYGLSDLLLYAKGEALSSMLALCVALILSPDAMRKPTNA